MFNRDSFVRGALGYDSLPQFVTIGGRPISLNMFECDYVCWGLVHSVIIGFSFMKLQSVVFPDEV